MSVITRSGLNARGVERLAAVGHRLRLVAVRSEKVAEQLDVEGVVLDDQDLRHTNYPSTLALGATRAKVMRPATTDDAQTVALVALAAMLCDERRSAVPGPVRNRD